MWKGYIRALCKNRKWYIVLPVVFLYAALTLLCRYYKNKYFTEDGWVEHYILPQFHLFLPLFAGWWIVMILSEMTNEEGNELLYLYLSPNCIRQCRFVAISGYLFPALIYFCIVHDRWGLHWFLFLQLTVEIFFVCGIIYCITAITNNTGAAMLVTAVYCIFVNKLDIFEILGPVSVFPKEQAANQGNIILLSVTLAVALLFELTGFFGDKYGNHLT